ncbi:MAG: Fungal specific transcription factor [Vezdaea aestivalis]|nr:MAG: Fungal specific transcription factor [Vezdaea aestivalis]
MASKITVRLGLTVIDKWNGLAVDTPDYDIDGFRQDSSTTRPPLFVRSPQPRKRKLTQDPEEKQVLSPITAETQSRKSSQVNSGPGLSYHAVDDYAELKGPSLLKKTLGLQHHRHSHYLGLSAELEPTLLDLHQFDEKDECATARGTLRRASERDVFLLIADKDTKSHADEINDLDAIEEIVSPYGQALINLYFRVVHPSFPILHKKVYLEKYSRSHREFAPPLLAAVYILALNWWGYSADLAPLKKPNVDTLSRLARKTIGDVMHRPKLSGIQAGLLLLQGTEEKLPCLASQLVSTGYNLGLHLDCSLWKIPNWERGLRKRLAWALYMQDKWSALIGGRPSHIVHWNWAVRSLTDEDFPENAADEDEEEGSTEVEKGRLMFREMIDLAQILSEIIDSFYTIRAVEELNEAGPDSIHVILQRAKPVQLRLKTWHAKLPETLKMTNIKPRKLSSTGYLHLAYFTAEMSLHRCIIRSLADSPSNLHLINLCRGAAKTRLLSAIDFTNSLRQEHLQAFWFSASRANFALIGTFGSLLWATSSDSAEAEFYKNRLAEYRWTLRVSSKGAGGLLEFAVANLDASFALLQHFEPKPAASPAASAGTSATSNQDMTKAAEDLILEDSGEHAIDEGTTENHFTGFAGNSYAGVNNSYQYHNQWDATGMDELAFMSDEMLWAEPPHPQNSEPVTGAASEHFQME